MAVLRKIAAGHLMRSVVQGDDGAARTIFVYDDGSIARDAGGRALGSTAVSRMVSEGWLIPIRGESLPLDGEDRPQRYRARRPEDGHLPRLRKAG
jgi:hypothetical protein